MTTNPLSSLPNVLSNQEALFNPPWIPHAADIQQVIAADASQAQEVVPVVPAEPAIPDVHPLVGTPAKYFKATPSGELLELEATHFDDGAGDTVLQVVNENNQIEWIHSAAQGTGDGQWQ